MLSFSLLLQYSQISPAIVLLFATVVVCRKYNGHIKYIYLPVSSPKQLKVSGEML